MKLSKDDVACYSPDKKEGLCDKCLRNIDLVDASSYEEWDNFTIIPAKNFKTKVHFRCDGFLETKKVIR